MTQEELLNLIHKEPGKTCKELCKKLPNLAYRTAQKQIILLRKKKDIIPKKHKNCMIWYSNKGDK
jgi:hypothetical protein